MSDHRQDFYHRVNRIDRKHRAMARAHSVVILPDGLIHVRPRRRLSKRPLKVLAFLAGVLILYKGVLLFHLGADGYTDRLNGLDHGGNAEQIGAWIMQLDPATRWIAGAMAAVLG